MSYAVVVTEQATNDLESSAAWWARERSAEQAERWYAEIRRAIAGLSEQPFRLSLSAEHGNFAYELRELHFGLGARPTHRVVFTIVKETVVVLAVRHAAQDRLRPQDLMSPR